MMGTQVLEESGHVCGIPDRYLRKEATTLIEVGPRCTVALIEADPTMHRAWGITDPMPIVEGSRTP
jgi:hypothetical protein